jgi:hypothetical protein
MVSLELALSFHPGSGLGGAHDMKSAPELSWDSEGVRSPCWPEFEEHFLHSGYRGYGCTGGLFEADIVVEAHLAVEAEPLMRSVGGESNLHTVSIPSPSGLHKLGLLWGG